MPAHRDRAEQERRYKAFLAAHEKLDKHYKKVGDWQSPYAGITRAELSWRLGRSPNSHAGWAPGKSTLMPDAVYEVVKRILDEDYLPPAREKSANEHLRENRAARRVGGRIPRKSRDNGSSAVTGNLPARLDDNIMPLLRNSQIHSFIILTNDPRAAGLIRAMLSELRGECLIFDAKAK